MKLELRYMGETHDSTVSSLWRMDGDHPIFLCFIIEDGFRPVKEPGKTRIPAGTYKLEKRTEGGIFNQYKVLYKHQWILQLKDVPGFNDILIHCGNRTDETRGCLLVNTSISYNKAENVYYGQQSVIIYKWLYQYLDKVWDDDVTITIQRPAEAEAA